MSYKNTMKLFASNFTLVWKQMAYLLCCMFIFTLSSYTIITPIINLLREQGIIEELKMLFNTVYSSPYEIGLMVSDALKHTITTILGNFSKIYLNLIGVAFLCILIPYILVQISVFNISSILHQKFTMNMDVNYVQNAIQTLKISVRFSLANIIFSLPFYALIFIGLELYLVIAKTFLSAIIGLVALSAFIIIILSAKFSIFSCYTGYIVEKRCDPFSAFGKGLTMIIKNFWKSFSISIIVTLTIIFVNGFIALFTFFSGLIVTIPASFVLVATYNLVTYFNTTGTRYYLSNSLIYNPAKYTVKKDDFDGSVLPPEEVKEIQVTTIKMKKKYNKKNSEKKSKIKSNSKKRKIKETKK